MPVGAAIGGAAVIGGVATTIASSNAADAQTKAADTASNTQLSMFNSVRNDLAPYDSYGKLGTAILYDRIASNQLLAPFDHTFAPPTDQASLEATPGYQFTLGQGLKAVNNAASARGMNLSGSQLKGIGAYTTGLADQTYGDQFGRSLDTYNTQFNAYTTQQQNVYNKLLGLSQLGENAAAQTGAMGTQTATQIGNNIVGAGNANAAASMASGNAFASGANNAATLFAFRNGFGQPQQQQGVFTTPSNNTQG